MYLKLGCNKWESLGISKVFVHQNFVILKSRSSLLIKSVSPHRPTSETTNEQKEERVLLAVELDRWFQRVRSLTKRHVKADVGRWMTGQRESGRDRDCTKRRKGNRTTRKVTLKTTKFELFLLIWTWNEFSWTSDRKANSLKLKTTVFLV